MKRTKRLNEILPKVLENIVERSESNKMKNQKHTPGPWKIERTHNTFEIARITPKPGFEGERNIRETVFLQTDSGCMIPNQANAQLIAAAPEMLEALECILRRLQTAMTYGPDMQSSKDLCINDAMNWARTLIHKARGES